MQTIRLRLPRPHEGQLQIRREARRWNVVCCGRRWGKSKEAISLLLSPALAGKPVAYGAPSYKMLDAFWRELLQVAGPVIASKSEQLKHIRLVTGGTIDMWSLDAFDSIRGRKYARFVLDEAAMVPMLGEAWQATIRPTLTDLKGDAYFLSTPRGHNFFYECFLRGLDPTQPDWACWQMPTTTNPYIDPSEVEAARLELPERTFQQEYLAQFLADGGGVFRNVTACSTGVPQEPLSGASYVIGVDWARSVDYSVFSVWDTRARREVCLDRGNQVEYETQVQRLRALVGRYNKALVVAERNSIGDPVIGQLQRTGVRVIPFDTTNASKALLVDTMTLALEQANVMLLNNPTATAEMLAYEATRLPSGMIRYSAPEGKHDDVVMARMLALHGITSAPVVTAHRYDTR